MLTEMLVEVTVSRRKYGFYKLTNTLSLSTNSLVKSLAIIGSKPFVVLLARDWHIQQQYGSVKL